MQEKLQTIKEKPQHVRENIALAISGGITLIVFLGWGVSLANSHTFAITSPIPTSSDVASPLAKADETKQSVSNLVGAVGAVASGSSTEPKIQIVDSPTQQAAPTPEQTVIHF